MRQDGLQANRQGGGQGYIQLQLDAAPSGHQHEDSDADVLGREQEPASFVRCNVLHLTKDKILEISFGM